MLNNRDGLVQHLRNYWAACQLPATAPVVIGVSGGLDSMVLAETALRAGLRMEVVHVNYGLRGAESDGDQALVEAWCAERNVPLRIHRADLSPAGEGIQAAARRERYAVFESVRSELSQANDLTACIATAHHADDQAETVLLQLIRAADPTALAAMLPHDPNRHLLRPFLSISRSQLEAQAKAWNVPFRHDSSNDKPDYLRNRLRSEVLPLLEELRSGTTEHLARWAERMQPLSQWIQKEVAEGTRRCWSESEGEGTLIISAWRAEPLRMEVMHAIAQVRGVGARAVGEIVALTEDRVESGAKFESREVRVVREKDRLVWRTLP